VDFLFLDLDLHLSSETTPGFLARCLLCIWPKIGAK